MTCLSGKRHWLFDMDGTLTQAMHDFDAMRATLELPAGVPILEALDKLPGAMQQQKRKQLDDMELEMAGDAVIQPGARELLQALRDRDANIGIVTRNGKDIAARTLLACNLMEFFTDQTIISRDCCVAKPDPAGVSLLLSRWSANAADAVMVGDYKFDLQAGKLAGVATVHLDVEGVFAWPDLTDVSVQSLTALMQTIDTTTTPTHSQP